MRWPWVSRELHDKTIEAIGCQLTRCGECYDALLEKYHALACPAQANADNVPPVEREEKEPSLLQQVIREQSDGDPRLSRHLRGHAAKLKRQGKSEEEIAQELTQWVTVGGTQEEQVG